MVYMTLHAFSRVIAGLQDSPRRFKQLVLVLGDACAMPLLLVLAWSLRSNTWVLPGAGTALEFLLASGLALLALLLSGIYRTVVRTFDEHFLARLMFAVLGYAVLLFGVNTLAGLSIPRSVTFLSGFLLLIYVWASRALIRRVLRRVLSSALRKPLLIYGAGQAGRQLAVSALQAPDFQPVALLDDDPELIGTTVHGLPVFSGRRAVELVERYAVTDIILAMPSATRARRREIIAQLESLPVHVRSLPGLDQLLSGQIRLSDVQEVDIADLLGRDAVPPIDALLGRDIRGGCVLVSGAGGSIGAELCRQILKVGPDKLVLVEHSEYALYAIERELQALAPDVPLVPVLASVLDESRLAGLMRAHEVQTIYHAAAYKHVPLVEANPFVGIRNNVMGTLAFARAASAARVRKFVLISTDKAVRPTNVMGASKRLAELVLQAMAAEVTGSTVFAMVRFGNVLGSSGSVVPLFRQQLAAGGPITVTHPEITRYFMTIPEAAQLVIQAGAMSAGGDVFVLDMGQPVRIVDLARQMIHLAGLTEKTEAQPHGDVEIVFSGLRPGEKLYEELLIGVGHVEPTLHDRILKAFEAHRSLADVEALVVELERLAEHQEVAGLKRLLLDWVEGYRPEGEQLPDTQAAPDHEERATVISLVRA